jgi:hypothetical protein
MKYWDLLERVLKCTSDWHFDHETILGALDHPSSRTIVPDAFRRVELNRLEGKIRKCPPLAAENRRLVGTWPMTGEAISVFVFTDRVMILEQKAEILSRKKCFIIRMDFFLRDVIDITREKNGIKLRMKGMSDIAIMIKLPGNEFMDVIKAQIQP